MKQRIFKYVMWASLAAVVAVLLISGATARTQPTDPEAAFRVLQSRAPGKLSAHWNTSTGIPDFLTGADADTRIPYTPTAIEHGNPVAIARGFLDENRALFKLTGISQDLTLTRVEPDTQLNYAHVRLAQVYHDIPVFGKELVVHIDAQERIVAVDGHLQPDLTIATTPSITPEQAAEVAMQDLREIQLTEAERARVKTRLLDKTRLMVYVDDLGKATLTWYVTIMTDFPLGQWRYFVNARRPVVVHALDSAEHVKQRKTYTADNGTDIPGRLLIEEGEQSRDAIAQAAHDAAGKVYDFYFKAFQRDGIDGQGSPMVSTVHYGSDPQDAENAAWVGEAQQMIYGDGGKIFKPLAYALDVVGHEFTHGITDATSQLTYQGQSGALNESYSDVFGVLIAGTDWTIARTIVKSPPYPVPMLRSLQDPSLGGRYNRQDALNSVGQPTTVSEYANLPNSRKSDNGGVHVNSGIPNHAAYLIGQAIGRDKLAQIYYRTLTQYLTPDSQFADAARATVRAAQDLYGTNEVNAVIQGWSQVGVNVNGSTNVPTPPPTSTTPQRGPTQPTPAPNTTAGCTNLIVNGGFESDDGWTQVSTAHTSIIDTELPHTGNQSAWLGGTDKEPVQYIYEDVLIPANATRVELDFYRLIHEQTTGILGVFADDAKFGAFIADLKGNVLGALEQQTSSGGDDAWHPVQTDLSQFAGKSVRVMFRAENPKGNESSFFVDDVQLLACTTGAGPTAPQTNSQNLVYVQGTIKSSATGRGIEGAQFFIIKPGLTATDAAADDSVTRDEIITMGTSDANGLYQTDQAIPRGQKYSVIVIANGYRSIVADNGINLPANAQNPYQVDATLSSR
ncbi:MAG: M4 family metallopeptidase [Anaerolineae bacterium]